VRTVTMCALAGLALAACATVTRGTTTQVQISSVPPSAEARTSMGHACLTPCTLQFTRKDEFSVVITKAGFHPEEVTVKTRVAGGGIAGFAGNVVLGGAIGMVVDAASGATLEHCPNPVVVILQPIGRPRVPVDHTEPCRLQATPDPPLNQSAPQ